jgi:hypothetical protein
MVVPADVDVEAVAAARHGPSPLSSRRHRSAHPDARATRRHEPGRGRREVREPSGRDVDRVGRLAARAAAVVERVPAGAFLDGENTLSTRSGLPAAAPNCASVVTSTGTTRFARRHVRSGCSRRRRRSRQEPRRKRGRELSASSPISVRESETHSVRCHRKRSSRSSARRLTRCSTLRRSTLSTLSVARTDWSAHARHKGVRAAERS